MSILAETVRSRREHIEPVAEFMREADVKEIYLASKKTPHDALVEGFNDSLYCWTILLDKEPIGIFGLSSVSILGNAGTPWLLGTDGMLKVRRQFVKESGSHVDFMNTVYPHLVNFVHAGNAASIRWLKSLNFTIHDPVPAGPFEAPFHKFERFADV